MVRDAYGCSPQPRRMPLSLALSTLMERFAPPANGRLIPPAPPAPRVSHHFAAELLLSIPAGNTHNKMQRRFGAAILR